MEPSRTLMTALAVAVLAGVCVSQPADAQPVVIETVPVGNPGNPADVIFIGELLDALAAFVVMRALHIELSLLAAVLVVFFIDFSNALPAAPGHLGTFEVGALYSLGFLGVGQDAALAFALVFHAQQALPQIVFGLPFQLHFLSTKKKQAIGQESV